MESKGIISLEDVTFYYRKHRLILDHVNMNIDKNEIIGIIGPSGEGKTTLLRLLNGAALEEEGTLLSGEIHIFHKKVQDIEHIYRRVGTIYQNPDDQMIFTNVIDDIVFGMENFEMPLEEMETRLNRILKLLDIEHLVDRNPHQLSGGEKQLIVLASILSLDVDILLLDEAFAAVDKDRESQIIEILKVLRDEGKTIVMVEHDMSHLSIADRIYKLEEGLISELTS